jgi:hypothetical protein
MATVLADARLQHRIEDTGRATLTSVASLGTELATVAVYATYAALAATTTHGTVFALFALPYLATALLLAPGRREAKREG